MLRTSWLKKISEYEEQNEVELSYVVKNKSSVVKGTAEQTNINSLRLGETYDFFLEDKMNNEVEGPYSFEACECYLCQGIY